MLDLPDPSTYWDDWRPKAADDTPKLPDRFEWTQYPEHGPDESLLGGPETCLELGCGPGDDAAYLATKGIKVTALDFSAQQCVNARHRWAHVGGLEVVEAEACAYLKTTHRRWDAIYSMWGSVWWTDPKDLLPLIRSRLTPSGTLVFAQAEPVPGTLGRQGMYGNGFRGRMLPVYKWAYTAEQWGALLDHHGFVDVDSQLLQAPEGPEFVGTLVVRAHAPQQP